MKQLLKRFSASLLALTMAVGMGTAASAATKSENVYDLYARDDTVQFWLNGKKAADYEWSGNIIRLTTDKDGDFLVGFKEDRTTDKWISLGDQKSLKIDGSIDSIKVSSALDSSIDLTVVSDAIVRDMELASENNLTINGSVPELKVNAAANVYVTDTGSVANARLLHTKATMTIDRNAKVKNVRTRKVLNIKGKGEADKVIAVNSLDYSKEEYYDSWRYRYYDDDDYDYDDDYYDWYYGRYHDRDDDYDEHGPYRIRLEADTIYASAGDTLSHLRSDLDDAVTAYVNDVHSSRDGDIISGRVYWEDGSSTEVTTSGTYRYEFRPSNSQYATKSGSVEIVVR